MITSVSIGPYGWPLFREHRTFRVERGRGIGGYVKAMGVMVLVLSWASPIFADEWRVVPQESIVLPNEDIILIRNEIVHPSKTFDHWRIDSEDEFRAFRESVSADGYELGYAPIDFSHKTLLAQYANGSCGAYFEKIVTQNDQSKKVKMEVQVKSQLCPGGTGRQSFNTVLVQKIPPDYEVMFSVKGEGNTGTVEFLGFVEPEAAQKEIEQAVKSNPQMKEFFRDWREETDQNPIEVFQSYASFGTTAETSIELKDSFPFNEGLKHGKRYKVMLAINKMIEFPQGDFRARYKAKDGRYYDEDIDLESGYAGLQNEKNEIEIVNVNWINAETIEEFWRAHRNRTSTDLEGFKKLFPTLNRYGVPPATPFYNGYAVLRLKQPAKVKLYPSFPNKDILSTDQFYDISEVFVKVTEGFGASGRVWYMKDGEGHYYDVDPRGPHYILLPTLSGSRTLLDTRWVGQSFSLSLKELSRDPFPEQKDLLDDFIASSSTKDHFGHP